MTGQITQGDIDWLERLKENGHCGEGASEMHSRLRFNERIDRIIQALQVPARGEVEAVARIVTRAMTRGAVGHLRPSAPTIVREATAEILALLSVPDGSSVAESGGTSRLRADGSKSDTAEGH